MAARDHINKREKIFNQIYSELKDISRAILEPSEVNTARLHDSLVRADALFESQSLGAFYQVTFYYPRFFPKLESDKYTEADLTEIAKELREILEQLSDETGINYDSSLTYKELKDIFSPFFFKWAR